MNATIERARAEFLQAKAGIEHALATTPDERVSWSPAPTARTPLQVVAHAAEAVAHMHGNVDGRMYSVRTPDEAERAFRESCRQYGSRKEVLDLLERNSAAYLAWLDRLDPSRLQEPFILPFGMGSLPIEMGLGFMADHLNRHTAQIAYIQTIYGDHDWHLRQA